MDTSTAAPDALDIELVPSRPADAVDTERVRAYRAIRQDPFAWATSNLAIRAKRERAIALLEKVEMTNKEIRRQLKREFGASICLSELTNLRAAIYTPDEQKRYREYTKTVAISASRLSRKTARQAHAAAQRPSPTALAPAPTMAVAPPPQAPPKRQQKPLEFDIPSQSHENAPEPASSVPLPSSLSRQNDLEYADATVFLLRAAMRRLGWAQLKIVADVTEYEVVGTLHRQSIKPKAAPQPLDPHVKRVPIEQLFSKT